MSMKVLQTLQRGLALVDFLLASDKPVRTTDVVTHFKIDKANASRLLSTLREAGYAERTEDRCYVPGPKLAGDCNGQLESLIGLRERARPLLKTLVDKAGECAHMAVLVGDFVWYVDQVSAPHPLRVDHAVGSLAPLHCTALGKALLALSPRILPREFVRYTNRTIVERAALQMELAKTRRLGYALDDEEYQPGIRCVASAIRDTSGRIPAAIGLSGPSARLNLDRLAELGAQVHNLAEKLSVSEPDLATNSTADLQPRASSDGASS